MSCRLSFENVEKVVKPPHKPTLKKRTSCCEALAHRLNNPHSKPISRQPMRLTRKVAHGNPPVYFNPKETRYRNTPPTKLPAPTKRIFFIMLMNCLIF